MEILHHAAKNVLVFAIPGGEASIANTEYEKFVEFIMKVNNSKFDKIAFDMSRKSFLNSTGLGELVAIKDNLVDRGMELILLNPTEKVESLINMVGLDEFFRIVSNEDEL